MSFVRTLYWMIELLPARVRLYDCRFGGLLLHSLNQLDYDLFPRQPGGICVVWHSFGLKALRFASPRRLVLLALTECICRESGVT